MASSFLLNKFFEDGPSEWSLLKPGPKGATPEAEGAARGFNPGEPPKPHRALKGRQTEHGENIVYQRLSCNHVIISRSFRANRLRG